MRIALRTRPHRFDSVGMAVKGFFKYLVDIWSASFRYPQDGIDRPVDNRGGGGLSHSRHLSMLMISRRSIAFDTPPLLMRLGIHVYLLRNQSQSKYKRQMKLASL